MEGREFMSTRLYWRTSFRQPKMGPFDYRVIFLIFPFLFYVRLSSLAFLAVMLAVIWVLQQRKVEPDNIIRWVRARMAGDARTAHGVGRLREAVDYGFEDAKMMEREERRLKNIRENRKSPKYKGRQFGDPSSLGANKRLPLRERFTTVRQG